MVAMGGGTLCRHDRPASFIDVITKQQQIDAAIIGNALNVVITSGDEIAQELLPGYKKHPVSISKIMESVPDILPFPR